MFFSEEKNQKTFASPQVSSIGAGTLLRAQVNYIAGRMTRPPASPKRDAG
jgi:hypothetical protein